MKSQIGIWWLLTVFFLVCAAVYTGWNVLSLGHVERIGTTVLLFSVFMSGMIGFFSARMLKAQKVVDLPEDSLAANIDGCDPETRVHRPESCGPPYIATT